jgi:regulator of protease activity HflC (stomatin/prohibitin superfamily)
MNELTQDLRTEDTLDVEMREVGPWGQAAAISFKFLLGAACLIALGWLASNIRQVPPDSQVIVMQFGAVSRVQGPGLLLAWPRPIEQVVTVPASARQTQVTIGQYLDGQSSNRFTAALLGYPLSDAARDNTGFLLTGDSSVVHLEAQIFYQITDPVAYMISVDHVGPALQRLFIASTVNVLAGRDMDTVLVARPEIASQNAEAMSRERLRADLVNTVNRRLQALSEAGAGLGIAVSRVDLIPTIPGGAKEAFDNVLAITQVADEQVAEARTAAQETQLRAESQHDNIVTTATANAEETVSDATVATASIAALGKENHDLSHGMLMSRLYYDRIGPIIQRAGRVEIVSPDGSARVLLPSAPTGRPSP